MASVWQEISASERTEVDGCNSLDMCKWLTYLKRQGRISKFNWFALRIPRRVCRDKKKGDERRHGKN